MYIPVIFAFYALPLVAAQPQQLQKKFLYKHSFRGPHLSLQDGTIPFWDIMGDAIASSEQLRLAPSMRSKQGAAWNTRAMTEVEFWEVEMSFKVSGQGRVGADGIAFWFGAYKGTIGPVFGSNDYWTGLGVFFDSFDNDAQRNNPYIMTMINDGTRNYDHQTDGSTQMLAGCQKDFRNRPFPVKVKIEYLRNVVTVQVHDGMTATDRYELCMRAENVFLPKFGYFGLSAATGGLADDHDVVAFSVFGYVPPPIQAPTMLPRDEQKKFEDEFERQRQQFEQERERYRQEHPDQVKPPAFEEDYSKYFEDATQRELRLIYEGQTTIHKILQQLDARLGQVLQQQTQITHTISQRGGSITGGGPAAPSGAIDTFQRHEVNEALQLARETTTSLRELRSYITDGYSKIVNIEQRIASGVAPVASDQGGAADQFQFQSVKTYLEGIKHDVEQVRTNQRTQPPPCPTVDSGCLSPMLFIVIIAAQSLAILLISVFKGRSEKAKFY